MINEGVKEPARRDEYWRWRGRDPKHRNKFPFHPGVAPSRTEQRFHQLRGGSEGGRGTEYARAQNEQPPEGPIREQLMSGNVTPDAPASIAQGIARAPIHCLERKGGKSSFCLWGFPPPRAKFAREKRNSSLTFGKEKRVRPLETPTCGGLPLLGVSPGLPAGVTLSTQILKERRALRSQNAPTKCIIKE